MGRRSDIDWEAVERLYVAGQLTIRQIANECGISTTAITDHAKADGWKRDLSAAIEARTKAKISTIDVNELVEQSAHESSHKSAQTIKEAIEQASDVAAGVILKHRASVRSESERGAVIEAMLDAHMSKAEEFRDIATVAQTFKLLVDSKSKLRDQERVIYGLDKSNAGNEETVTTITRRVI